MMGETYKLSNALGPEAKVLLTIIGIWIITLLIRELIHLGYAIRELIHSQKKRTK